MDDPIIPFDLGRMFLGDAPPLFYAEILFRTVLIYGYTLTMIRWIGGRSVAQLSLVDMLLVIAVGSAVGDATFYDDVPLLHAMLVITAIVGLNKLIDTLSERSLRFKNLIDGRAVTVVVDGRILPEALAHRDLNALEVQAMLRTQGISNLGEVAYAYLEAGGGISVFRRHPPKAGLPLVPAYGALHATCTNIGRRQPGIRHVAPGAARFTPPPQATTVPTAASTTGQRRGRRTITRTTTAESLPPPPMRQSGFGGTP